MGDFFTVAVRTGDEGMGGISLLLLEAGMPGLKVRKMETQFDSAHSTTFVTMENVKVPARNLIGEENGGFMALMTNCACWRAIFECLLCDCCQIQSAYIALATCLFVCLSLFCPAAVNHERWVRS